MSLSPSASTSLRRFDFDAISASSVPFGLLVVPGHEVQIGGKEMSVFGYPTEEASTRCVPGSGRVVTRFRQWTGTWRSSTEMLPVSTRRAAARPAFRGQTGTLDALEHLMEPPSRG